MSRQSTSTTRRALLAAGGAVAATGVAGCATPAGGWIDRFDESDPLVTYDRIGKGRTSLSYWTSTFYMPAQSGNNQPELSPLTGPFTKSLARRSAQPAAAPVLRAQHEEWARRHPDYRIDITYPELDGWKATLARRADRGTLPDGSTIDNPWTPAFYGHLQPLTDHVDDIDDFFPFVRETAVRDGELVAAWKYTDCRCLYYRQDLVDRHGDGTPPRTWAEVIDLGREMASGEVTAGFALPLAVSVVLPLFWGQGARLVDEAGAPVLSKPANRRAVRRTLDFLSRLVETGATPPSMARIGGYERVAQEARAGRIGMFLGGSWQIEKDFKNRVEGDRWRRWKVAPIPVHESGRHVTAVGGWAEGAFARRGSAATAMREFVATFVEPEWMGRYCEAAGLLPTRESLFGNRSLYDPDVLPYYETFRELLRDGRPQPAVPVYATIRAALGRAVRAVLSGERTPAVATERLLRAVSASAEG